MHWATGVWGERIEATPDEDATCPICGSEVIAKCGRFVAWHWAHRSIADCDPWAEGETEWHVNWKRLMPSAEVTIQRDGMLHRADAVARNGTVIEFQHSSISADEIEQREHFYGRMVWVFDAQKAWDEERISISQARYNGYRLTWNHRRKTIEACKKPVYLDIGPFLVRLRKQYRDNRWMVGMGTIESFRAWANGLPQPKNDTAQTLRMLHDIWGERWT